MKEKCRLGQWIETRFAWPKPLAQNEQGGVPLHNTYTTARLRGFGTCIIIANHHRNGAMIENRVDEALSLDLF